MVCVRCKMAVQAVLEKLDIAYNSIEMGRADLCSPLGIEEYKTLDAALRYYELELMDNKKSILVDQIKVLILEMIRDESIGPPLKFTAYLSRRLGYNYTYISNVFSEAENSTIERHYITQRIERVKELIVYEEMSLKEIAYQLNYSSVSHLCLQFKKVTGNAPSTFKKLCQTPGYAWKNEN